ncbi:MAG: hypothetical protein ACXW27_06690 [Allosphingosinicella sp.]
MKANVAIGLVEKDQPRRDTPTAEIFDCNFVPDANRFRKLIVSIDFGFLAAAEARGTKYIEIVIMRKIVTEDGVLENIGSSAHASLGIQILALSPKARPILRTK